MKLGIFFGFLVLLVLANLVFAADSNDVLISDVNVSPAALYASKNDQTVTIDVNAGNFTDGSLDMNVLLFYNAAFADSNSVLIDVNTYKIVQFTMVISGGTYGSQTILASLNPVENESNVADNNYSEVVSFEKIDVNVSSVSPAVASGALRKGRRAEFSVTAINSGTSARDVNVLFYSNGILADSNSILVASGQSKVFTFTKIFSDFNNDLNFVVIPDLHEYETNDNNYYLRYVVLSDQNDAKITGVSFLNSRYSNRQLKDTNFLIAVTVANIGSGNFNSDLNVRLYVDGNYSDSNTISIRPGDSNVVYITKNFSTVGTYDFTLSIAPLSDETSLSDNNSSAVFVIDGNMAILHAVSFSAGVYPDTNQRIDFNAGNYGPTANLILRLFNKDTNALLDTETVSMGKNDNNWLSLYTGFLSTNGVNHFTASIGNLANEYIYDNNLNFNITVGSIYSGDVNHSNPTNNPGSGDQNNFTPGTVESNSKTATVAADLNAVSALESYYSSAELEEAKSNTADASFTRVIVNLATTSSTGSVTYKTKIKVHINKAFSSSVKELKVVEIIPKTIASNSSKISSDMNFKVLKSDPILEFTLSPSQDVVYYIDSNVDTNAISDFNSPIIMKITLQEQTLTDDGDADVQIGDTNKDSTDQNNLTGLAGILSKLGIGGSANIDLISKIGLFVVLIIAAIFVVFRIASEKKKKAQGMSSITMTKSKMELPKLGANWSGLPPLPAKQIPLQETSNQSQKPEIGQQKTPLSKPFVWKPSAEKKSIFESLKSKLSSISVPKMAVPTVQAQQPQFSAQQPQPVALQIGKIAETALDNSPSSGIPEEFSQCLDAIAIAEAKLNSIGTVFSRKMICESYIDANNAQKERTKIIIQVKKSFLKETKSLNTIEAIPKQILADISKFRSDSASKFIGENVVEFTIGIDDDIVYYIDENVGVNKIILFKSPLITKINSS
ncbi:MAG: hypothetical protein NTZ73_03505 [Candidatus Diapherotrites archaeon]|nr:hypothetical protein [Candidatus Diapherotrites archaeon]